MSEDIRPWSELQAALPPLANAAKRRLQDSLREHGVVKGRPVLTLPDGRIIDGAHRWELAGGDVPVEVLDIDEDEAFALGISLRVARGQLSNEQIQELHDAIRERPELQRQVAFELRRQGKTQKEAAAMVGVPRNTLSDWEADGNNVEFDNTSIPDCRVRIDTQEHDAIYARLQSGETQEQVAADYSVSRRRIGQIKKRVETKREKERKRQNAAEAGRRAGIGEHEIINGDFRNVLADQTVIPDASVAMVFTDPPYDAETVEQCEPLAEHAARVLVDGGSLITYVGHYCIGDVIELMSDHLRFWWTCGVKHQGANARLPGKWVFVEWKPLLWFVKDERRDNAYVGDMAVTDKGEDAQKEYHEWQQDIATAEHYIRPLTSQGEVVLDPFAGSGTTIIGAHRCGCIGVGIELDEEVANIARGRIAEHIA